MYKISVPVHFNKRLKKEESLEYLKKCGASRVFIGIGTLSVDDRDFDEMIERLPEFVAFYKENGLEVGAWLWTFWRKGIKDSEKEQLLRANRAGKLNIIQNDEYQNGDTSLQGFCCPESELFLEYAAKQLEAIARCGFDIIMFDDDFGYGIMGNIGCYCDKHMKLASERLGREYTREELFEAIYSPKPSEVRTKWHRLMGESLENFSRRCRGAVDRVNPDIRLALCCCWSVCDTDGTDPVTIAKLLAGNTKPIIRMIGAPYWDNKHSWGNCLQHTIELERMEFEWYGGKGIETMTEGDVFPRPRHRTPAALLEGFDTALRTAGVGDGILKYMLDYTSSPSYETGYIDKHLKNADAYKKIEEIFGDKKPVGIRVFETAKKFDESDFSGIESPRHFASDQFFSRAARMLADNTVPTVYSGDMPVGIVFGENARYITHEDISRGLILDIRAAKILKERGFDVGIESIGEKYTPAFLYYPEQDEYVQSTYGPTSAYRIIPKASAKTVTYSISTLDDDDFAPDTIFYENAEGTRFLVYGFDAAFTEETRWRSYANQKLIYSAAEWIGGEPLPVKCAGNPDLYVLCKKSDTGMSIGLWNFSIDEIDEPKLVLDRAYDNAEFFNCAGEVNGEEIKLSPIPPYAFAFIDLK